MDVVRLSHQARTPHLGSSLSCVDMIAALYFEGFLKHRPSQPDWEERDLFFLSKGHAVTTLYAALARSGYFNVEHLFERYFEEGGPYPEHPAPNALPGIEFATGSLGHGLSVATGAALANKMSGRGSRVFALLSDGECNEGSTWEAAMWAGAQGSLRICAMVDFNKWQATGRSAEVMALEPFEDKFRACGWRVARIDGNNPEAVGRALSVFENDDSSPLAIIADTVKGKGISFMEDDNNWHYRIPTEEEVGKAKQELGLC
ncbi:MAG: transketolase [Opitutales bacterium]